MWNLNILFYNGVTNEAKTIANNNLFTMCEKTPRFRTTREIILRLSVPDVVIPVSKSEKHTDKKGGH